MTPALVQANRRGVRCLRSVEKLPSCCSTVDSALATKLGTQGPMPLRASETAECCARIPQPGIQTQHWHSNRVAQQICQLLIFRCLTCLATVALQARRRQQGHALSLSSGSKWLCRRCQYMQHACSLNQQVQTFVANGMMQAETAG